ncbi:hypothetical protein CTA1_4390 [Colletotrichum tanaceti]|uniref:Uncharacterized protein n=1 Tax=Colletotrichum tanaceti TaxID=1306861 RepID=A0A4U6X7D6_9PEZI|nr:hypothetical protein CTA1_4390 [Colletotrichum tanaceti]
MAKTTYSGVWWWLRPLWEKRISASSPDKEARQTGLDPDPGRVQPSSRPAVPANRNAAPRGLNEFMS